MARAKSKAKTEPNKRRHFLVKSRWGFYYCGSVKSVLDHIGNSRQNNDVYEITGMRKMKVTRPSITIE